MNRLTALVSFIFLVASSVSAGAQTPAPTSPPAAGVTGGGLMDYWWMILLVVIIAAAIWYFMRGRTRV
jgi:uncharacterized protein HemX